MQAAEFGRRFEARIARGELDVPLFPEAARKVIDACERESCDMRQLAEIVRRDPALAAQFLRLANSPLFGSRAAIVSLPQALARMGTAQTRQIALLVTCQAGVFACASRKGAALRLRAQAVATALWAQEIARVRRMNCEETFLCGLLEDVGMPALWQLATELEVEAGTALAANDVDAHIARLHHEVGADIAERWALPRRVVSAIRLHHASPDEIAAAGGGASLEGTVAAVQLAEALALRSVGGTTAEAAEVQAHPSITMLSLYGPELDELLARGEHVLEAMRAVA
ncbi:MAG: signal transduction protein [Labilithrix sp.]|nr:signal transduction protein [Labilithrix sp.]